MKLLFAGLVLLPGLLACAHLLGIRYNVSDSEPCGLYVVTDRPSDTVVLCLPRDAARLARERGYVTGGDCPGYDQAPVLKQIVAWPGDAVEYASSGITVNGTLLPKTAPRDKDSLGRPLHHYPFGRYTVQPGMAWMVSSHHPRSFDSRYFGPVSLGQVREHLRPLVTRD